jgi:hypothetical protein
MSKKEPNPRKIRQFEKAVRVIIDSNGGADKIFRNFNNRPSDEFLIKMFIAGKFGGDDPLSLGGVDFALEYVFDEFNEMSEIIRKNDDWQNKVIENYHVINRGQDEAWSNLFFSIFIDKDYAPFVSNLDKNEFIRFTDRESEFIHNATKSIIFSFAFIGILNRNNELIKHNNPKFSETDLKKSSIIYHYGIWITSPDVYAKIDINLKTVENPNIMDAIYRKNKLLEAQVPWDGFDDHIVYTATDSDGVIRYVGEGRSDRYLHVNSGKSHNYKINEHFFLNGKMNVNIVSKGLTKPKTLAIEKFLIARNSKTLWNIKDNPDSVIKYKAE